ncbi:MAG: winged helix-turn-helix domain-containing protein, partial [Methanosarcinales archaeon]|nr:winged helix-turn-helix domain-containing protein [Methanosarcinales archaeon]
AYLDDLVKTLEIIEKEEKFWKEHDLEAIPTPLLMKINELGDTQIAENSVEQLYEPHKVFLDNIARCKKVSGISPIVHPSYPEMFLQLAKNGIEVSLLLTKNAFMKVKSEYADLISEFLSFDNASLYVSQGNIKFTCIVTDTYFSISLFYKNGIFDSRNDLVGEDTATLSWGDELFNYHRERAEKIEYL